LLASKQQKALSLWGATVSPLELEATVLLEIIGISHTIVSMINMLGVCFLPLNMLLRAMFNTPMHGASTGTRACLLGAQPSIHFVGTGMAPRAPSRGPVRATAVKETGQGSGTGGGGSGSTTHLCQIPVMAPLSTKKKTRMRRHRVISRSVAAVIASVSDYFEKEKRAGKAKNLMRTVQRTSEACGVGTKTVCKVKQCDLEEWEVDDDHVETRQRADDIPSGFLSIIRCMLRDFFIKKQKCLHVHASMRSFWRMQRDLFRSMGFRKSQD
jgi:hypothetical protein